MTLTHMRAVYTALRAGLPLLNVTRAWPQAPVASPSCSFRLSSCALQADGTYRLRIQVLLRVQMQEEGDTCTALVLSALVPLGYQLLEAREELENETGFFLRAMDLQKAIAHPNNPEQTLQPLSLRVYLDTNTALELPAPFTLSTTPATRRAYGTSTLSFSGSTLPPFAPGRINPGSITVYCPWQAGHAGLEAVRQAFLTGGELLLDLVNQDKAPVSKRGMVTSFHVKPPGCEFVVLLREVT